ncbi:MAG: hypothetical protein ABSF95_13645 [Verrucomicrobiota bacterium]
MFRDVIQLPLVYGSLSKPGSENERLYAGFSVGNAYLEPCGPYPSDAPFSPDQTARFHGLTFSPATSLGEDTQELARRGISHAAMVGGGSLPRFVYFNDALLTGELLAVSIWEVQDKQDRVNLGFLSSSLQEAKGGALGVKRIDEVRVGCPGQANVEQWGHFLTPAKHEGEAWFIGNGPVLRLVPSKANQIESIVLKVESLEQARTTAAQRNLLGKVTLDGIELDPAKTSGLRILLKEK